MNTIVAPEHAAQAAQRQTAETWALRLASGVLIHVPPTLRSMSTYVLLEQERWFEPEMSLVPHLVAGGVHALDIGANHGVVALEMARASGGGRVWAFEPTAAPRAALAKSVRDNAFGSRITVLPYGLADEPGSARFAVQDNSELNSRYGPSHAATRHERVQLRTLDHWLDELRGEPVSIGFVKLDAEGDETRVLAGGQRFFATQSPVVMFELKHGAAINHALLEAWPALGYELFRWSDALQLLRPFDAATDELAFALNLVAVRPAQQAELAARGLLVTAAELATATLPAPPRDALAAWAAAHFNAELTPVQRLLSLVSARDSAMSAMAEGELSGAEDGVLLVSCLHALGAQHAAVVLATQVLSMWSECTAVPELVATPLARDLTRARSTSTSAWLCQLLDEYVSTHSAYSSYFDPASPGRWAALMEHPDHSTEVERRWLLAHAAANRIAPAAGLAALRCLPDAAHTANPALWRGLIASMECMSGGR